MGKGGCLAGGNSSKDEFITWDEVKQHTAKNDTWIVIGGGVYDVSRWMKKHPGGAKILNHFAGQDATEAWRAMHLDHKLVGKYLKSLFVGKLKDEENEKRKETIRTDFEDLRQVAIKNGWFKTQPLFFVFHLGHIMALEALAIFLLYYFGNTWSTWWSVVFILSTVQAQAGWSQHDYGHQSVLPTRKLNKMMHHFVIGHIKGASSHWWNFRHFQHHTKPNVIRKDPDVSVPQLFLLGDTMAKRWAENKKGFMPYNHQHSYFWLLGPPVLLPVYFHLENLYFASRHRDWVDLLMTASFFLRLFYTYTHFMTAWQVFWLYMTVRFFESFWFVFVTQMSHIPMEIEYDQDLDWLTSQTIATCNVEPSLFNDWFTGHLNFQIEHHLFPTMPRHNYIKIQPLVKSLCAKHNLDYVEKPLSQAFSDIIGSLRQSGEVWADVYYGCLG